MFKIYGVVSGGRYLYCRTDPMHPQANSKGLYPLHRVVMANYIGRILRPDELVHHRNENKFDNRKSNLEMVSRPEHARHHALQNSPQQIKMRCPVCKTEFEVLPSVHKKRMGCNKNGLLFCSRSCGVKFSHIDRQRLTPIKAECGQCGEKLILRPSEYRLRTKRNKHGLVFCSKSCGGIFTR